MKKCSKSHHTALAELNITPLLDLAFVLLVIFIITTTPIVNDLELSLPRASKHQKDPKPKVNYVTIDGAGTIFLNKEAVDLPALEEKMVALRVDDPDLNVVIRGDARAKYAKIVGVMDVLQQANVGKINLATEPFADSPAKK
jgi:biopolymer transport protein ExbD